MNQNQEIFNSLGFEWDRDKIPLEAPIHDINRVCFRLKKMLPEYVWHASFLEGNPFTYPQVKTILDGITVGGHKLSDQSQVENLAESTKLLITLVETNQFKLNKATFTKIHAILAKNEALEWGNFRGEGSEKNYTPHVALGLHGEHLPEQTINGAPILNKIFIDGLSALEKIDNPIEKSAAFFLFGALQQFFFDGNKRTSRMMMNGILMTHGIDAISIPASKAEEFNEKMVSFYLTKNATEMMDFIMNCHPENNLFVYRTPHKAPAFRPK